MAAHCKHNSRGLSAYTIILSLCFTNTSAFIFPPAFPCQPRQIGEPLPGTQGIENCLDAAKRFQVTAQSIVLANPSIPTLKDLCLTANPQPIKPPMLVCIPPATVPATVEAPKQASPLPPGPNVGGLQDLLQRLNNAIGTTVPRPPFMGSVPNAPNNNNDPVSDTSQGVQPNIQNINPQPVMPPQDNKGLQKVSSVQMDNTNAKLLCLLNNERKRAGLQPLQFNSMIYQAAKKQSEYMASVRDMTHWGPNEETAGQRVEAAGYRWRTVAENVAMGQKTAENVVMDWVNSPGHRANILNPNAIHFGGYVKDSYWCTVFGSNGEKAADSVEACPPVQSNSNEVTSDPDVLAVGATISSDKSSAAESGDYADLIAGRDNKVMKVQGIAEAPNGAKGPVGTTSRSGWDLEMTRQSVCVINMNRQSNARQHGQKVQYISFNPILNQIAAKQAQYMSQQQAVIHTDQNGMDVRRRATALKYRPLTITEIGARSRSDASLERSVNTVMKALLSSKEHKDEVLDLAYMEVGVGRAEDGRGQAFWCLVFGTARPDGSAPKTKPRAVDPCPDRLG